ncbi:hypothetical protein M2S00_00515 [Apilactobacillus sp. TMW 2.2459]|uniref:hypothetical protein n=1 Tax=Apilactobacillus xinyiensis TaxID=2841032 RepID=UPI001C7CA68C|nr:hypothetical protein [Apilactobacillus xinyiensis]MCL0311598.1 hypothetical protein [Apilactobacillus xinyiensis]
MQKGNRKNQDKLEKKFKNHWYTKWWIYIFIICAAILSSYVYKKVETQRLNNVIVRNKKIKAPNLIHKNVFEKVPKKQRHRELTNYINNKILNKEKYKITFNKSDYLIIDIPKNNYLIEELNNGRTKKWEKLTKKLNEFTKWISNNYGELYANVAIVYNNEQNKVFFLSQNGHIKFNVSDKIKENLKNNK